MRKPIPACAYLLACLVAGCSSLPPGAAFPRQATYAGSLSSGALGRGFPPASFANGKSGYYMLAEGVDGLAARLELIDTAQHTLDLQYYIFRADVSGTLVARALLRAADRGVRVRVLVDDGETVAGDERLFALAAHPLIQIRVFNPLAYRGHAQPLRALEFLLHKQRLDHRMHNKLLVADNAFVLIGGRNIGDQYFQITPDSQFGDTDVAAVGPIVQQLSSIFDEFWNTHLSIPVQALEPKHASLRALQAFRNSNSAVRIPPMVNEYLAKRLASGEPLESLVSGQTPLVRAAARPIYDSPDKATVVEGNRPGALIHTALEGAVNAVDSELLMVTPFFVPSPTQLAVLTQVAQRGARVRALTNSLEAAPTAAAQAGYSRYRVQLLTAGVELYEIRARVGGVKGTGQPKQLSQHGNYALHAKLYVFDRKTLFVGSMNFDQRSEHLNTEIGLLIDSPELAAAAAKRFDSLTLPRNAYSVRLKAAPSALPPSLVWTTEENGVAIAQFTEPARNGWQRFKIKFFTWLPLEHEL